MTRTIRLLVLLGVAAGAIWFAGVRRRGELPGLVTHGFNPLVMRFGLAGGRLSPWGILEHVGRTSGIIYRTPISIIGSSTDEHVFVRLSYGADVHWVKNVQATGHCRLQLHKRVFELDDPAVVSASDNPLLPPPVRRVLEGAGRQYLRLHVRGVVPGMLEPLDPVPNEAPTLLAPGSSPATGQANARTWTGIGGTSS